MSVCETLSFICLFGDMIKFSKSSGITLNEQILRVFGCILQSHEEMSL